jgi:hypothetical protein
MLSGKSNPLLGGLRAEYGDVLAVKYRFDAKTNARFVIDNK